MREEVGDRVGVRKELFSRDLWILSCQLWGGEKEKGAITVVILFDLTVAVKKHLNLWVEEG